jgi:predicted nucleotidyltransferase
MGRLIPFPRDVSGVRVRALLDGVRAWAADRPDVLAVGLVGSWARGAARPDSDVDLVLVVHDAAGYFAFPAWLAGFGSPTDRLDERRGALRAMRVWFADGPEVEFGFVRPAWCEVDPVDPGVHRVVRDGLIPLYDPDGLLADLMQAVERGEG